MAPGRDEVTPLTNVVILGAGPAGLSAAYELTEAGVPVEILEADERYVGGLARTISYQGHRFDIGAHRFFTKAQAVKDLWHKIVPPEDWLTVSRRTRILYKGKFIEYPLKPLNALRKLGVFESALCLGSYAAARAFPRKDERSFEDWVRNRFGDRLYRIFFKTYTEKVWGMPCSQISADWAAQRIKGLSLSGSLVNALLPGRANNGQGIIRTLIDEFEYPKCGTGTVWERAAEHVRNRGGELFMGTRVTSIKHRLGKVEHVTAESDGSRRTFRGAHFISSIPVRDLVNVLDPPPPPRIADAANALSYRDFLTVMLVVGRGDLFPDNWIYVHDPTVKLGRITNFNNWSPCMAADGSSTVLALEYFCFEGDGLWQMEDRELLDLGARELDQLGLCDGGDVEDGMVVRTPKAYPVYDEHYLRHLTTLRAYLEAGLENLQLVGRNGMHKYNNQDHSMMTGLLAARNLLGERWDPWSVNTEAEYLEESRDGEDASGRLVPRPLPRPTAG